MIFKATSERFVAKNTSKMSNSKGWAHETVSSTVLGKQCLSTKQYQLNESNYARRCNHKHTNAHQRLVSGGCGGVTRMLQRNTLNVAISHRERPGSIRCALEAQWRLSISANLAGPSELRYISATNPAKPTNLHFEGQLFSKPDSPKESPTLKLK